MPTSAVLNVGKLNDFILNVTTAAAASAETDGSEDYMALDGYLQRQQQYRSITADFQVSIINRSPPYFVIATPRSLHHTLFVQRVVYLPSDVFVADTLVTVHNGATPIRYALRATVPMVASTAKGVQSFVADYGPNGLSMGEGNSLLLEIPAGGNPYFGTVHVEGYQRTTRTMTADTREATTPRVVSISLRPNPVVIGVSGRIGCLIEYDQPLVWGPLPLPLAIELTSTDLGSYPSILMNADRGPFNSSEVLLGGRGVWAYVDMDTTPLVGRIYKVTDQSWRNGWPSLRGLDTGTRILDNFNGVSGLLKV